MSPMAVTTAPVCSRKDDVTPLPRPPQPSSPRRTAELASVPHTNSGLMIMALAVAAAPMNSRRPTLLSVTSLIASSPFACCLESGGHGLAWSSRHRGVWRFLSCTSLGAEPPGPGQGTILCSSRPIPATFERLRGVERPERLRTARGLGTPGGAGDGPDPLGGAGPVSPGRRSHSSVTRLYRTQREWMPTHDVPPRLPPVPPPGAGFRAATRVEWRAARGRASCGADAESSRRDR